MTPEQLAAERRDEQHFVDIGVTYERFEDEGGCPVPGCDSPLDSGTLIEGFIRTNWRATRIEAETEMGVRLVSLPADALDEWVERPVNPDQPTVVSKNVDGLWQIERRFIRHYRLDEEGDTTDGFAPLPSHEDTPKETP